MHVTKKIVFLFHLLLEFAITASVLEFATLVLEKIQNKWEKKSLYFIAKGTPSSPSVNTVTEKLQARVCKIYQVWEKIT